MKLKSNKQSLDKQNKLTLKITQVDGKSQYISGVVNVFGDDTCSVFRVKNNSYVISI